MKKIINKNTIFTFILGVIISGVTAYAVSNAAKDITFKAGNTNWKVGNVADALDSLYISRANNDYSTNEKVVGKWIDGKPLYQITITGSTSSRFIDIVPNFVSDYKIDKVADMRIVAIQANGAIVTDYNWDNKDKISCYVVEGTGALRLRMGSDYPSVPLTYYITVQYTKTENNN